MGDLAWGLILSAWVCCLALVEPLSIGWHNYKAYRKAQRELKAWAMFYARNPCRSSSLGRKWWA